MLRRIAFTGDFLRFAPQLGRFESSQLRNVRWLQNIVTGCQAWRRPDLAVHLVFPARGRLLDKGRGHLHKEQLAAYEADHEMAWAQRYASDTVDMFSDCMDALLRADLVIGFELPPVIKRHLHRKGQTYLSFQIHPLRLLRDLCFSVSTNSPQLAAALESLAVGQEAIDQQIHHHQALCSFHGLPIFLLPRGLPVLIGQTARDSALIEGGRFSDWADHAGPLAEHLRGHDAVVLLEHPYRPDSLDIAEHLRSDHGKTVLSTNGNGYALLLTNPEIPMVLTLSSSLAVEAQSMGYVTHFLLGDPRQRFLVPELDLGPQVPLGHGLLTQAFWSRVLDARQDALPSIDPFALGPDHLRSSLDGWSYKLIRDGLSGASNRTHLLPAAEMPPARVRELVKDLGRTNVQPAAITSPAWQRAGIDLQVLDAPLQLGQSRSVPLSSAESQAYLAEGFHAAADSGRWSRQATARLRIAVAPEAVSRRAWIHVRLRLLPPETLLPLCPVVRASVGSRTLGYAFFRPAMPQAQDLPLAFQASARETFIDLEISDVAEATAGTPGSPGASFLLAALELRCNTQAPPMGDRMPQIVLAGIDDQAMGSPLLAPVESSGS